MGRLCDCRLSNWWAQLVLHLPHPVDCPGNRLLLYSSQDRLLPEQPSPCQQRYGSHMSGRAWGGLDDLQGQHAIHFDLDFSFLAGHATNPTHHSLSVTTHRPPNWHQSQPHWVEILPGNKGKICESHTLPPCSYHYKYLYIHAGLRLFLSLLTEAIL